MTERYEHNGTYTDSDNVVHDIGCGISMRLTKCGIPLTNRTYSNTPDNVTCPNCIATFPGWLLARINDPLVKTEEGYYVHWSYVRRRDTGELRKKYNEEHTQAAPPSYYYDKKYKKWALAFCAADSGGYDVQDFIFYFDSEEDILKYLKKENR